MPQLIRRFFRRVRHDPWTWAIVPAGILIGLGLALRAPPPPPSIMARPLPTAQTGQFTGSARGQVFHLSDCPYARRIAPPNRLWFQDAADAASYHYRPCLHCRPDAPAVASAPLPPPAQAERGD